MEDFDASMHVYQCWECHECC